MNADYSWSKTPSALIEKLINLKGNGNKNFVLSYLKERLKLSVRECFRFFISCLILEIFSLKATNCPPS